jgi:phage tail sheath gpL-like
MWSLRRARRGPLDIDQTLLIIGQKLAAGTAEADEPVLVTHPDQADNLFGKGSILARMYRVSYANNSYTETWCLPLDDDGSAQAAAGALLFAGTVSKAGTLSLLIGGTRIRVAGLCGRHPG